MAQKPSLRELAVQYAMLAPEHHQSYRFSGDDAERHQARIKQEMLTHFNAYDVQEAIKQAHETLKMVAFHPPQEQE